MVKVSSFLGFRSRANRPTLGGVSEFLVEVYVTRENATSAPGSEEVAAAAEALTREGRRVRLVRSIFVPEDETCFYMFQAETSDAVREAATRAGLRFDRVRKAVTDGRTQISDKQNQGEKL